MSEDVTVRSTAVESPASTRTDDSDATLRGPRLVSIPGGLFTMGTDKPGVPGVRRSQRETRPRAPLMSLPVLSDRTANRR